MVILDVAIVNVALPSIKSDLHFSQTNLQWVISAYAIMFGGVLLLGGRLADLLGRRRLFVGGLALFAVSSLLCGLAWSEGSLIAFRAVQGLGGALLAPAALSLLMTTFAEGPRLRKRSRSRRPARRRADLVPQLVLDLLHQRTGRRCCDRARARAPAGGARGSRPSSLRRSRRCLDHGRVDAARLRGDTRDD
ncbi:MAG: MFS transporter [Actinobacteria bacterium]|nr:MAG: MFS transporter [Actinomycetota bacterium]